MRELKLSIENSVGDAPDLNRFRIGDHVVADACEDCDRHEGVVVGIELQRLHGSEYLVPSITLLHDGYLTDGFKPIHLRKVYPDTRATTPTASEMVEARQDAIWHDLTFIITDFLQLRDETLASGEANDEERQASAEHLVVSLRSALRHLSSTGKD